MCYGMAIEQKIWWEVTFQKVAGMCTEVYTERLMFVIFLRDLTLQYIP